MDIASRDSVVAWLSKGDPAIRWQVSRDLLARPLKEWRSDQARVAAGQRYATDRATRRR
jgi:hypothetical protein